MRVAYLKKHAKLRAFLTHEASLFERYTFQDAVVDHSDSGEPVVRFCLDDNHKYHAEWNPVRGTVEISSEHEGTVHPRVRASFRGSSLKLAADPVINGVELMIVIRSRACDVLAAIRPFA